MPHDTRRPPDAMLYRAGTIEPTPGQRKAALRRRLLRTLASSPAEATLTVDRTVVVDLVRELDAPRPGVTRG